MLFIVPVAFWLFLFRDLVTARAFIIGDSFSVYCVVKFFLDSLQEAVFPLWDPFLNFGEPYIRHFGEFNPILILVGILSKTGLSFYPSFLTAFIIYFLLGVAGFYWLALRIFQDKAAAYFCFVLLLFSSLGMNIFNQITIVLIYVPVVWFFYFLLCFYESPGHRDFMGCVLTLSMIITTYIPFYFLTVFLFMFLGVVILYPADVSDFIRKLADFFRPKAIFCFIGAIVLAISLMSAWFNYRLLNSDLNVPVWHSATQASAGLAFDYEQQATNGAIQIPLGRGIFSASLIDIPYSNERFFYVPFFVYLTVLAFPWTRANRRMVLFTGAGLLLFFICLTKATPVYPFFFRHVFYFKLFRNLHLFIPFISSLLILLAAEQLSAFFQMVQVHGKKFWGYGWIIFFHAAIFVFLLRQEEILLTTFLTLLVSLVFFLLAWGRLLTLRNAWTPWVLLLAIILQPVEVLWAFQDKAKSHHTPIIARGLQAETRRSVFSYTRPMPNVVATDVEDYNLYYSYLALRENSPVSPYRYGYPPRWSYELSQNLDPLTAKLLRNRLLIFNSSQEARILGLGAGRSIWEGSQEVRILRFDPNKLILQTHFLTEQFFVLTDSYHPFWRAWINEKEVPIERALGAFRGIRLPCGPQVLRLKYQPWGAEIFPWITMMILWLTFADLLYLSWKGFRGRNLRSA